MTSTATGAAATSGAESTGAGSRKRKLASNTTDALEPASKAAKEDNNNNMEEESGNNHIKENSASEGEEEKQRQQQIKENTSGGAAAKGGGSPSAAAAAEPDRNEELLTRIQEVEEEKRMIEEGTHPDYQRKSDALQRVRDRRVFAAERFKQMQMENIQGLYEYEVLEAECSYKTTMDDLKARLLDTMEQRVKRLEEDRERVLKQLERVGQTRVLRSKNVFRNDNDHPDLPSIANKLGDEGFGSVSMFLSESEIKDDLKKISTDLAERAKAYYDAQSDSMVDVSVEDNCLHYNDHCLLKGESIIFTSMLSGEDFFGRIASIRPHEVLVKLSDGTKARIHMSYLKNGRIKLKVEDDMLLED